MTTVGVSIASIPIRGRELARALESVTRQTWPPDQISVHVDHASVGAAAAKNAALAHITTDYVAFLDDDDEFLPRHLEALATHAVETGADMVYPWFTGLNRDLFRIPLEDGTLVTPKGQEFSPRLADHLRITNWIPTTALARTSLVKEVGGFTVGGAVPVADTCDDWGLWIRILDAGGTISHLDEVTWQWNSSQHTSGRPWREALNR